MHPRHVLNNRYRRKRCTSNAPVKLHLSWFVFRRGITTDRTGMVGLYLAISLYTIYIILEISFGLAPSNNPILELCTIASPCSAPRRRKANDDWSLNFDSRTHLETQVPKLFQTKRFMFLRWLCGTTWMAEKKCFPYVTWKVSSMYRWWVLLHFSRLSCSTNLG
jgi:hypothetical protein